MAVQAWDTSQTLQSKARSLDHLLYVDGKTSSKIAQEKELDVHECRALLEELRLFMWNEGKELEDCIRNGY